MTEQKEPDLVETGNTSHSEDKDGEVDDNRESEPAHHARRPMNAFLIFCKKHRSVVREKYPNLENRSITKILGEWWANLEDDEKASYTGLAKRYKDAFFNANPDFKWYKLPAPPLRTLSTRPTNIFSSSELTSSTMKIEPIDGDEEKTNNNSTKLDYNKKMALASQDESDSSTIFNPGKLADEAQMGGLSSLMTTFDNRNESLETQSTTFLDTTAQISLPCTPKYQGLLIATETPGPPRKRSITEIDSEQSNKYFKEESIPSQVKAKTPQNEQSIKELQNALSETSRILEKAFELEDDSMKGNCKLSNIGLNKNGDRLSKETEDQMINELTQQEIIDRVVNSKLTNYKEEIEPSHDMSEFSSLSWEMDFMKDSKAAVRSCKGKRYQEFMAFGGLYVNKRQKRDYSDSRNSLHYFDKNISFESESSPSCSWKNNDNLDMSHEMSTNQDYNSDQDDINNADKADEDSNAHANDSCESNNSKMFKASDFDLDAKIHALPSLSFEKFHQKKRENKKRKSNIAMKAKDFNLRHYVRPHIETLAPNQFSKSQSIICSENKVYIPQAATSLSNLQRINAGINNSHSTENISQKDGIKQIKSAITGSKKRKPRKVSITRLDINNSSKTEILNREQHFGMVPTEYITSISTNIIHPPTSVPESEIDLCALETLAEVAASTSKMNENN